VIEIQQSVNHRFQTVHVDRVVPCSTPSTDEKPAIEPTWTPLESQVEAASGNGAQGISETITAPYSSPSVTRTGRVVRRPIRKDQLNSRFHGCDIFREIGLLP